MIYFPELSFEISTHYTLNTTTTNISADLLPQIK